MQHGRKLKIVKEKNGGMNVEEKEEGYAKLK